MAPPTTNTRLLTEAIKTGVTGSTVSSEADINWVHGRPEGMSGRNEIRAEDAGYKLHILPDSHRAVTVSFPGQDSMTFRFNSCPEPSDASCYGASITFTPPRGPKEYRSLESTEPSEMTFTDHSGQDIKVQFHGAQQAIASESASGSAVDATVPDFQIDEPKEHDHQVMQ